eukprot:GHVU01129432.1.p2 GENE.GHVU01129432.1~~GHVU01129432.1.p2  ORF type:complete len:199 (+),score=28.97 GHVU01129432.1:999-1595(+)
MCVCVFVGVLLMCALYAAAAAAAASVGLLARAAYPDQFPEQASVAFFVLIAPIHWVLHIFVALLALLCVTSSVDSMQNGIAVLIGMDLLAQGKNLNWARLLGVVLNIPAAVLACFGFSVVQLFMVTDVVTSVVIGAVVLGPWRKATTAGVLSGCSVAFGSIFVIVGDATPRLLRPLPRGSTARSRQYARRHNQAQTLT